MLPKMFLFNVSKTLLLKHMTTAGATLRHLLSSAAQKRLFSLRSSNLKAHVQHVCCGSASL